MTVTEGQMTPDEVVARGKALYEENIRAQVEEGNVGRLLLAQSLAQHLNLPQIDQEVLKMADGSLVRFAVHAAVIAWQGEERTVAAHVADGEILIGIELLRGNVGNIRPLA